MIEKNRFCHVKFGQRGHETMINSRLIKEEGRIQCFSEKSAHFQQQKTSFFEKVLKVVQ